MVKRLLISSLFLVTSAFANATSAIDNVNSCMSGTPSQGTTRSQCVQSAISTEENNQISTLFQIYATNTNSGISYYGSQTDANTPNTPGNQPFATANTSSSNPGSFSGSNTNAFSATKSKVPAQGTPQAVTSSQSPGATPAPSNQAPKTQGGIQYY